MAFVCQSVGNTNFYSYLATRTSTTNSSELKNRPYEKIPIPPYPMAGSNPIGYGPSA